MTSVSRAARREGGVGRLEQFRLALQNVVREACELTVGLDKPIAGWRTVTRQADGALSAHTEPRVDLSYLTHRVVDELRGSRVMSDLIACVKENAHLSQILLVEPTGSPVAAADEETWISGHALVAPFLGAYFHRAPVFSFEEACFEATFEDLAVDLRPEGHEVVVTSPLVNVGMSVDEIPIAAGVRVRRILPEELELFLNMGMPWTPMPMPPFYVVGRIRCALERRMTSASRDPVRLDAYGPQDTMIVDLFRLHTSDPVFILFTTIREYRILFGPSLHVNFPGQDAADIIQTPKAIDAETASEIVALWEALTRGPNSSLVEVALRRFGAGLGRQSSEDRLIDYWIGLESLFLRESTELRFRAALRIAHLLGSTSVERLKTFDDVKTSYDARSAVVHGESHKSRKSGKMMDVEGIAKCTGTMLRVSLLRILNSEHPYDPTALDKELLSR